MLMRAFTVVLAAVEDEKAAAAAAMRDSKLAGDGAVGVLVLDDKGEVKPEKVGKHSTVKSHRLYDDDLEEARAALASETS